MHTGRTGRLGRRRRWSAALLGGLLLLAGCSTTATTNQASPTAPTPASTAEGSPMASAAAAGLDPGLADAIDQLVGRETTYVRAVLIARHGSLAVERYYRSTAPTDRADVHSVTKSVMSALIGIAIAEGKIAGIQATLAELLPSYRGVMSPEMATVTLAQLLTMTAGLPGDPETPPNIALVDGKDWVTDILGGSPTPGEVFRYSSAGSHLLSAILVEATGVSTLSYARTSLFAPLGFDVPTDAAEPAWGPGIETAMVGPGFAWATDTEGIQMGYSGLKLSARELAMFGQLYLDGGRWKDQQIVPQAWVTESTRAQVPIPETTSGLELGYGYQWWVNQSPPHPGYAAIGFGGQRIFVIPDLDMVAVVTQDQAPTEYQADRIADDLLSTIVDEVDAEPAPTTS